jgi:hypothetical protein
MKVRESELIAVFSDEDRGSFVANNPCDPNEDPLMERGWTSKGMEVPPEIPVINRLIREGQTVGDPRSEFVTLCRKSDLHPVSLYDWRTAPYHGRGTK